MNTESSNETVEERGYSLRRLILQVREDYREHQRDWTLPGFRALAVHRYGVWASGWRWRLMRRIFYRVYWMLFRYVRNHYGIELNRHVKVGRRLRLGHQGGMVIGASQIGDDCVIRQNVTVGSVRSTTTERWPILMNRVEVGPGAVIMGAIVIGDDVRIGPNAVVTMDVPAGAAVMAPLARIIPVRKSANAPDPAAEQ